MTVPTGRLRARLGELWKRLSSIESYVVPKTRADLSSLDFFPFFSIENISVFAPEATKVAFRRFVRELQLFLGPDHFSRTSIAEITRDEIQEHFRAGGGAFKGHIERIVASILQTDKERLLASRIFGLQLEGIPQITRGYWRIATFTPEDADSWARRISGDESWKTSVRRFFDENFVGHACLFLTSRGDRIQAKLQAERRGRYIVNTLRYGICAHLGQHARAHTQGIEIDIGRVERLPAFSVDMETLGMTMHGLGAATIRRPYMLTSATLRVLQTHYFLADLWDIVEQESASDAELGLVSAVTWLGDAQADRQPHISYIKYWSALESLITGYQGGAESERLKTSLPVILGITAGPQPSKSEVERLYRKRSDMLHGRELVEVEDPDLNKISDWAWRAILGYLSLRGRGYSTRAQIITAAQKVAGRDRHG